MAEGIYAQRVREIYEHNAFMKHCGIELKSVSCGKASVGLCVDAAKHTNLNDKLHGGLLLTLIDNATGIACAAVGKRVVTVSLTVDFIKGAASGTHVEAQAEIIAQQDKLLTMSIQVYDTDAQKLLAKGMSTMLSISDFPGIPEQWD